MPKSLINPVANSALCTYSLVILNTHKDFIAKPSTPSGASFNLKAEMARQELLFAALVWLCVLQALIIPCLAHSECCYASIGGARGHVYQFDGGAVTTDPASCGCLKRQLLLTRAAGDNKDLCRFDIFAEFEAVGGKRSGLSRLGAVSVKIDGKVYRLMTRRKLSVNGHKKSVPYGPDQGVRIFYSGEDLVLVHKTCDFWVTYDGQWTATYRLGGSYRGKVNGLAGNCDGKLNDKPHRWLSVAGCRRTFHRRIGCLSYGAKRHAEKACSKVINANDAECSNRRVLKACIRDACSAETAGGLRKQILCASFYLQSRQCAGHNKPLAWRHRSGCPLKCGKNEYFTNKASPCPTTCGSHFFGSPKRCFHLPSAEGCRCNPGHVLNSSNKCVRPEQCHCLTKLCLDRMPRGKCLKWRAQGRCKRYPEVMSKFCRETCGHCKTRCGTNQLSDSLCAALAKKGKCRKLFYKSVCSAACGHNKCRCPRSRRIRSKCSKRYKNRSIQSIRWLPGPHGKCIKSVLVHYEPCGYCPYRAKTQLQKCNYCTGERLGKRILQRREHRGKYRCLERVKKVSKRCRCPPSGELKAVSLNKCEHHKLLVHVIKVYQPSKICQKCKRITKRRIVKKIKCPSQRVVLERCKPGRKYRKRRVYVHEARHCKCRTRLHKVDKLLCSCSKKRSVSNECSSDGLHIVKKISGFRLKNNKCVPWVRREKRKIACERRLQTRVSCDRKTCTATKHYAYFQLKECRCTKKTVKRHLGKCCCPRGYKRTERVDRYWKRKIKVFYELEDYKCEKKRITRKFCIACPKPESQIRCDKSTGSKVYTKIWYVLKDGDCIKRRTKRVARLNCKHGVYRRVGPCRHYGGRSVSRYRKVHFEYYKRKNGGCACVKVKRTVKELCGCPRGSFVKTTKCPKSGCSGKKCRAGCHYTKTFFYFSGWSHEGKKRRKCKAKVFKHQRFLCCCSKKRRVKTWCKADKYTVKRVIYRKLSHDKQECNQMRRYITNRVRCPHNREGRSVTKRLPHPKPDYYYLATYRWRVKNCRCSHAVAKRVCRRRCHRPKISRHCNRVTGEWVTRRVSWKLRGCRTCTQRVRESRTPVRCSRKATRVKRCNRNSGILTIAVTHWKRDGCNCVRKKKVHNQRCKCPKPIFGKRQCDEDQGAYVTQKTYWLLRSGRCVKRRRTKVDRVKCTKTVRRKSVCKAKSGAKLIYIGVLKLQGCSCEIDWSLENRLRCNCDRENKSAKSESRSYCDKRRNLKVTVRYRYVLKKGHCVRRRRTSTRGYSCPPSYTEKRKCDEKRRVQVTLKHYSVKRNCACVRAVRRRSRKCGCPRTHPHQRRYCRKAEGLIVTEVIHYRWSDKKEQCITKKTTKSHRVSCSQKTHYSSTRCKNNKFYVETKVYSVRKGCQCVKRREKKKRNCHCKTITRQYKCPKAGFTRRIVTQIRRWNSAKKACKTVRYVTRRVRCRCPAAESKRYCHSGAWITRKTSFALRHGRCYKRVKQHKQRVACRHRIRHRYTACHKSGCKKRHIYTMVQTLDPKRCSCYYKVIKRRACPCCCPKTVKHRKRCVRSGTAWKQVTVGYHILNGKQCGCKRRVQSRIRQVTCSKKRQLVWLACNRHKCVSYQRETRYVLRGCRCHKVSRLTGKRRVCCCRGKATRRRFCRNSSIYERITRLRLKNRRCVREKESRLLRKWHCKPKPKTGVGKCDRSTCRQALHDLVTKLDRPRCRCRRVLTKRRHRICCCLQRPKKTQKCDSATDAWVSTHTYHVFNPAKHVCVQKRRTARTPVHCSKRTRRQVGSCNKHTCRRVIKKIRYEVHKCRCRRRVERSSRICCCPPAKLQPTRCDASKHEWVQSKIYWRLVHGRCVKRVTKRRRQIRCHSSPRTRVHSCNRRTCKRKITKKIRYKKGCHCAVRRHVTHRTCCCRPAVTSNTKCLHNTDVVKFIKKRVFDKETYSCRTQLGKRLVHRLKNCRNTFQRGKCNQKTRYRTIRKTLRRPKDCKCEVYRRITRRILCRCPETRIRRSKCNKTSCKKSTEKIWYTSHDNDGKLKCQRHRRVIKVRCCCKHNPSTRVYCDRSSGATKRESQWTVFVAETRSCVRRRKVELVRRLVCKKSSCTLSKCDKKTGYRTKVCTLHKRLRHKCSCGKRTVRHKIICHCPNSSTKKFCKSHSRIIMVITSWKLSREENRCIRRVKTQTKHLACSKKKRLVKKCPTKAGCKGRIYQHRYVLRHCRCHRMTRYRFIACCCLKPTKVKRCLGDRWVTVITQHKLKKYRCLKKVKKIRVSVKCKRKRVQVSGCSKDCNKHRVTFLYKVKNCKCVLAKRKKQTKKCCCPKPRQYTRCKAAEGVVEHVTEFWRLTKGTCLKRRRVSTRQVSCREGWTRAYKCNKQTRHQKVIIVRYNRVGCQCRKHKRIRNLLCKCRPSRIVKEKCTKNLAKRSIYRISYHLSHPRSKLAQRKCLKRRKLWFTEPCHCPKSTQQTRCSHKGSVLTIITCTWKLVKRLHGWHHHKIQVHSCVRQKAVRHQRIRCKRPSVHWSKCHKYRKTRTTIKHYAHRCKCRSRTVTRKFACHCEKKSSKSRRCDAKAGDLVYTRKSCYSKRGAPSCSCTTRRWRRHVRCKRRYRRHRITKRNCGLKRNNAFYNKYSIEWTERRGCGCVRKRRTVVRFCRCQSGLKTSHCAIDGKTWVKTRISYRKISSGKSGCKKVKRVTKRRIMCEEHGGKARVRYGGCEKHCKRSVSVHQCYVKKCRTKIYFRSRLQLCCKPKPKRRHYCDKKAGKWVTETVHYKLVTSAPLLKDRKGKVLAKQMKLRSETRRHYRKVHCPKKTARETCHRRTGYWQKTTVTWHRVGCHCRRQVVRLRGRCKCPPKRVHWGPCRKRHRVRTTIKFKLHNRKCLRDVKKRLYLCACPKARRYTLCDGKGAWKTCHVTYHLRFREQRCEKKRRCRRRLQTCQSGFDTQSKCKHYRRVIKHVIWRLNRGKCKCTRVVRTRTAECDCEKRRSRNTVCKHGAYVTTFVSYRQKGEKCAKVLRRISQAVRCTHRRTKQLVKGTCVRKSGHTRRGYQKLLKQHFERRGCKCYRKRVYSWVPCICHLIKRYRSRQSVHCSRGHVTVHKKVYYVLRRKGPKCIKRVMTRKHPIVCKGNRTERIPCKKNSQGDAYSVTKVYRRHGDGKCGCVWRLAKTRRHVCHCRPGRTMKKCVHHRTLRTILISYHPVHDKGHCRGKRQIRDKNASCPDDFSKKGKCVRCTFSVRHYSYKLADCRCVARKVATKRLRCCCPRPVTRRHCDAKRHLIVAVTTSYKLRDHRCHLRRTTRSRRVRCNRIKLHYRVSKCGKDGFRQIRKTKHSTVGCLCRKRTIVRKQRCSCPHTRIYKPGKCGRRFAHDIWLGYKLKNTGVKIPGTNKPVMKCVKTVVDRLKRRCRCPKKYSRTICRGDDLIMRITVSYRLHANSCQRKRVVQKRRLPCHVHPKLAHRDISPSKCLAKHGYTQTTTFIYLQAKRCQCRKIRRVKKQICDCLRKYGGKKRRIKCVNSNRLVKKTIWMARRGHGCAKQVKTAVKKINCPNKQRIKAGVCSYSTGKKSFQIYRLVARDCRCVWHPVKRVSAVCRCPKPKRNKECHKHGSWVTTKLKWRLAGSGPAARCVLHRQRVVRRVKCRVGKRVHRSRRCNRKGYRVTVIKTGKIINCKCLKHTERKTCRCRCPRNHEARVCRGKVWVTVRFSHKLANCSCRKTRQEIKEPVTCPKKTRTKGACLRGKNGDFYKKLVKTSWRVSDCKCHRIRKIQRHLCGCDTQPTKRTVCMSGLVRAKILTKRHLVNGACRRVRVYKDRQRVYCGKAQVRRVCDKRSGILSVIVVKPYVKNCRCYKRVVRHKRRCGCHLGRKQQAGKCNPHTCRQRLSILRRVLDKNTEECVWRRYQKIRTCCCRGIKRTVKCDHKEGFRVETVTKRVLRHWHCVNEIKKVRHPIKCKSKVSESKKRLKGGILKLKKCKTLRKGCKCVKRCRTSFQRYRCKRPQKQLRCHCVNGQCRTETLLTHWRLAGGDCHRQVRVQTRPTVCPPQSLSVGQCNEPTKYGFFYVKRTVEWRQKDCRCVRISRRQNIVCRCWPSRLHKRCHGRRGVIEHVRIRYQIRKGRCTKSIKRTEKRVRCGDTKKWRYSHKVPHPKLKDTHLKIYERNVRTGCECKKHIKKLPCKSRCPTCVKKRRCSSDGREVVSTKTCWHLTSCKCVRRVVTKRRQVRCPNSKRRTVCHRDGNCDVTMFTKKYRTQHCRCVAVTRKHRTDKKCCCPRSQRSRSCVDGSIRFRTNKYQLRNGRCHLASSDVLRPVNCPKKRRYVIEGRCKHGLQSYSLHYWTKHGCKCVRRKRTVRRHCGCQYKIVELVVAVDLHSPKETDASDYQSRVSKFLEAVLRQFKHGSTKVRTVLFTYSSTVQKHHIEPDEEQDSMLLSEFTDSKTNLHGALKAIDARLLQSKRHYGNKIKRIVLIVTRGRHTKSRQSVYLSEKIKRLARVFVIGFDSLPKSGRYVKWLASRPTQAHYLKLNEEHEYHFSASRIFEHACLKSCQRRPTRHVGGCKRDTCKRLITQTTWRLDQRTGKCRRHRVAESKACCCLGRNSNRVLCLGGRRVRVIVRHKFDSHLSACRRVVHKMDISAALYAQCRQQKLKHRGKCNANGWRHDKLAIRYVDKRTCHCRTKHRRLQAIRCRCPPTRSRHSCQRDPGGHWYRVKCRIDYRLHQNKCEKRRQCSKQRVVCRHESKNSHVRGRCHKASCRRRISIITYSIDKCRCRRKIKTRSEICCCKRKSRSQKFCDKRRHIRVQVLTHYRLIKGACRPISRRREHPVPCPSRQRKLLGQCQRHANGYYRQVAKQSWHLRGCRCVRQTRKIGLRLCRCLKKRRRVRQCQAKHGVRVIKESYLHPYGNHCRWRSRIVGRERITCSSRRVKSTGRCGHGKAAKAAARAAKDGRKFAILTITWKRRDGCKCRQVRRSRVTLCACSKRTRRIRRCHANRLLIVTVYHSRLKRLRNGSAQCKLVRKTSRHPIRCQRPDIHVERKCHSDKRSVRVSVSVPDRCRCKTKVYKRLVPCKAACTDKLPKKVCQKWAASKKIRICYWHPHLADQLCAATCRKCCKKTTLVYSGERCLTFQSASILAKTHKQGKSGLIIAKKSSFEACSRSCEANPHCRSFDYHRSSGHCRLLRINHHSHLRRISQLKRTPGCLLFEKTCQKKRRHCPNRRVLKASSCKCRPIFGKHQRPICYRQAIVAVYYRGGHGCYRKNYRVNIPCSRCEDQKTWCKRAAHDGKCSKDARVRKLCRHSCHQCKRHREAKRGQLLRRRVGPCSKSGWKKITQGGIYYDRKLKLWRVQLAVSHKRCVPCPVGSRLKVGPCENNGKRKLTWIVVSITGRDKHRRCRVHKRKRLVNCGSCGGLDRVRKVGRCVRVSGGGWQRALTTSFTERDNRLHRCVVRHHTDKLACSPKCPKRSISRSPCKCGKRVMCTRYYVTYPHSLDKRKQHRCVAKKITKTERCVSTDKACKDYLSRNDCQAVKRLGKCSKMSHLCAETCGRCK